MMKLIYFEIYRGIIRLKFDVWWEEVVMGRDFSLMFLFYTHVAHVMLVDLEIYMLQNFNQTTFIYTLSSIKL